MSIFKPVVRGECVVCGKVRDVLPVRAKWVDATSGLVRGICDGCSYAGREEWNAIKHLRMSAESPEFTATYIVLPKLQPGHPELDIGSYEMRLVRGDFPSLQHSTVPEVVDWLRANFHIITWPEVVKRIYVGFDSETRFSEVLFVAAWGDDYKHQTRETFEVATFAELLSRSKSPQAGFHLGIKGGFEMMLWRRELAPQRTILCTFLRSAAMKYMGILRDGDTDSDVPSDALASAYWKGMSEPEQLGLRQLLSILPPPSETPPSAKVEPEQGELPFAAGNSADEGEEEEVAVDSGEDDESSSFETSEDEEEEEGERSEIRGPLEPK
jgi:hypothetical protein